MTAVARCKPFLKLSVPALLALAGSSCGKSIVNSPHPAPPPPPQAVAARLQALPFPARSVVNREATVQVKMLDERGQPVPRARVEWILSRDGVGEIVSIHDLGSGDPTAEFLKPPSSL